MVDGFFDADFWTLACEGESDGDTEGGLAHAFGDVGLEGLSGISSSITLGGKAGYTVPLSVWRVFAVNRDLAERGDQGLLSPSAPLCGGGLLGVPDAVFGDLVRID